MTSLSLAALLLLTPKAPSEPPAIPSVPISVSVTGLLPKVVEKLNAASGTSFRVTQAMASQSVLIRCENQPADVVWAKVLKRVRGRINEDGAIVPDGNARNAAVARSTENLIADLRKMMARAEDEYKKNGPLTTEKIRETMRLIEDAEKTQDWSIYMRTFGMKPANRVGLRALNFVDLAAVAKMPPMTRLVFSTKPNKMQLPMKPGVIEVVKALRAETQIINQAIENTAASENNFGRYLFGTYSQKDDGSREVAEVLLRVQGEAWGFGAPPSFQLTAIDKEGGIIFDESIDTSLLAYLDQNVEETSKKMEEAMTKGTKFEISEEAKAYMWSLMFGMMSGWGADAEEIGSVPGVGTKPSPEMLERAKKLMEKPTQYEPLDYTVGPVFQGYAEAKKVNIVFGLSDFLTNFTMGSAQMTTDLIDLVFKSPGVDRVLDYELSDQWIEMGLANPDFQDFAYTSRASLEELYASYKTNGRIRLADQIKFASTNIGAGTPMGLTNSWINAVMPDMAMMSRGGNHWFMRFLGALPTNLARELESGKPISVDGIGPVATQRLSEAFFRNMEIQIQNASRDAEEDAASKEYARVYDEAIKAGKSEEEADKLATEAFRQLFSMQAQPYMERTKELPDGIPSTTTISLKTESRPMLWCKTADPKSKPILTDPTSIGSALAWAEVSKDIPKTSNEEDGPSDVVGYDMSARKPIRVGDLKTFSATSQLSHSYTVTFNKEQSSVIGYEEAGVGGDGKFVTLGQLPKEVLDMIEQTRKEMLEYYKDPKNRENPEMDGPAVSGPGFLQWLR